MVASFFHLTVQKLLTVKQMKNYSVVRYLLKSFTVYTILVKKKTSGFTHTLVTILLLKNNSYTEIEGQITGMPIVEVTNLKEAVQQPVVKVLMVENPEHLQMVESKLQNN